MRADRPVQPGTAGGRRHQFPDRVRAHRRAEWLAEQVDEHEITVRGPRNPPPFELVGVKRLHRKEIQRHRPLPTGLGPRPIGVVAAHHVQVRPGHLAPQRTRVHEQVHIAAAQPTQLPAAQPGPGHQQHDQPVARRAARPQQRDDLTVTGSIDRGFRLTQPMPSPHPPRHAAFPVPGGLGKVAVVGDLVQQRHQTSWGRPGGDRVHHHASHRGQHPVDPRR